MHKEPETLGEILKTARMRADITMETLAERVDITERYLYRIENEGKKPSFDVLYKLIRELAIMNQLDFTVDHAKDPSKVLVSAVFYIILSLFEIARTVKDFVIADVELRHEVRNVKKYVSEYRFLQAEKLNTMTDIKNYIDTTKAEINKFERSRALTDNKRRRAKTPEEKQQYKDERRATTERITPLRKKLKQAEQIYNKSPRLIDLLDKEYQIERKTYERTK